MTTPSGESPEDAGRRSADRPVIGPLTGSLATTGSLSALITGPIPVQPTWLHEPEEWTSDGSELVFTAGKGSDFWRHTHYGVVRDTGHFLGTRVKGEFIASVEVSAELVHQYDQAGLMVRIDAERWVKAGLEVVDNKTVISTVATHAVSDWAMSPLEPEVQWLGLRLTRRRDSLAIETSQDGGPWRLRRLAYMPAELPAAVGPMAASPDGPGFEARFRAWKVRPI